MSYDLRIAVKVEGAEKGNEYAIIAEPEYNSPTYNIGEMFRRCTGWDFDQFDLCGDEFNDVIAWMPLPKPYMEDKG